MLYLRFCGSWYRLRFQEYFCNISIAAVYKSFIVEDFVQEATNWHFLSQLGPETLRLAGFSGHHYLQIFLQIFCDTFQETFTYIYFYRYFPIFSRRPLLTHISTDVDWYFSWHHYLEIFLQILSDTFQGTIAYRYF